MSDFSPTVSGCKYWGETPNLPNKYPQLSKGMTSAECPENSFAKPWHNAWSKAGDHSSTSPPTQQLLTGALGVYENASHQPDKSW